MLENRRTLTIITGASRGIGKEIALQMARRCAKGSAFLLTARNEKALLEAKQEIRQRCEDARVWIIVCDMGNFNEDATMTFNTVLREITELESFHSFFLYHNCGTVGDVSKKTIKLNDEDDWRHYLNVNLISMITLNNLVLKWISNLISSRRFVVNITSLVAIQGFPCLTQYAVGKAAREAFFRGLAVEEKTLKVLSYSPGPVDTDMHDVVAEQAYDSSIRKAFSRDSGESEVNRSTLTTEQTVNKLMKILHEATFESGARIDYFDDEPKPEENGSSTDH